MQAGFQRALRTTVKVGETDGITYSTPKLTTSGDKVTVEVTATPASGKEIDDQHLPEGWKANGDGTYTFTTTITQPNCVKTVTPVIPTVGAQVCPVDSTTPVPPSVTGVEDTDEIDYSEPQVTAATARHRRRHRHGETRLPDRHRQAARGLESRQRCGHLHQDHHPARV